MPGVVKLAGKRVRSFCKGPDAVAYIPQGRQLHIAHLHQDESLQAQCKSIAGTTQPFGSVLTVGRFTDLETERHALPLICQCPGIILHGSGQDGATVTVNFKYFSCFTEDIRVNAVSNQIPVTGPVSCQC